MNQKIVSGALTLLLTTSSVGLLTLIYWEEEDAILEGGQEQSALDSDQNSQRDAGAIFRAVSELEPPPVFLLGLNRSDKGVLKFRTDVGSRDICLSQNSCGCMDVTGIEHLQAGNDNNRELNVSYYFDVSRAGHGVSQQSIMFFDKHAKPVARSSVSYVVLGIESVPSRIAFQRIDPKSSHSRTIKIVSHSIRPIESIAVECSDKRFAIGPAETTSESTLKLGQETIHVNVAISCDNPPNEDRGSFSISIDCDDNALAIPGTFSLEPQFQLEPAVVTIEPGTLQPPTVALRVNSIELEELRKLSVVCDPAGVVDVSRILESLQNLTEIPSSGHVTLAIDLETNRGPVDKAVISFGVEGKPAVHLSVIVRPSH